MDSRTIVRLLEADGWYPIGQSGSHLHFKHGVKPGKVTVPHPKKDFPVKTLRSIEKQAGIRLRTQS